MTDTINGVKYVKIDYMVTGRTDIDRLTDYGKRNDIIMQKSTIIKKGSYLSDPIVEVSLLVPESIVLEFNRMSFKKY